MTVPLLIGEASRVRDGRPFDGRAGRFLGSLVGLSLEDFLARIEAVNLLKRWPGRQAVKGHLFPMDEAKRAVDRLDLERRDVILAGKRVAAAFGLKEVKWLREVELGRGERSAVVIPHPSGIVRWWNEERNRRAVGRLLERFLRRGLVA